jgi:hypothetical protein
MLKSEKPSSALDSHIMAMEFHSLTVWLHLVTFLADFALGMRMLISASQGHCAYKGGSNCSVHVVLGSLVTAASFMDYIFAMAFLVCIERVCLQLDLVARKVRHCYVPETGQ